MGVVLFDERCTACLYDFWTIFFFPIWIIAGYIKWLLFLSSSDGFSCIMKDNIKQNQSSEKDAEKAFKVETPVMVPSGSGASGGTRAGLFRTPISGGVQSATSAHGLPRPALAVRNLMEQVNVILRFQNLIISCNAFNWLCFI